MPKLMRLGHVEILVIKAIVIDYNFVNFFKFVKKHDIHIKPKFYNLEPLGELVV